VDGRSVNVKEDRLFGRVVGRLLGGWLVGR
jgi:hypothetical protein